MNISSTLNSRGIGRRYHDMSLSTYEHKTAKAVLEWFDNEAENDMIAGKGAVIIGATAEAYDIAVLATRAIVLKHKTKLRCVSFIDAMSDDVIGLIYDQHPPLTITNFRATHVNVEKYKVLENCLEYYLDNRMPFLLHLPTIDPQDFGSAANPVFVDRVLKTSKVFTV